MILWTNVLHFFLLILFMFQQTMIWIYKQIVGYLCVKPTKINVVCENSNIDYGCTKPFTPKNVMVEKTNDSNKKISKFLDFNLIEKLIFNRVNKFLFFFRFNYWVIIPKSIFIIIAIR